MILILIITYLQSIDNFTLKFWELLNEDMIIFMHRCLMSKNPISNTKNPRNFLKNFKY